MQEERWSNSSSVHINFRGDIAEIEVLWLSRIEIWGEHFTSIFSMFSVLAGWIAEMLFMLFFAYIAV